MTNKLTVEVYAHTSRDNCPFDSKPKHIHEFDVLSADVISAIRETAESGDFEIDGDIDQGADGAYYASTVEYHPFIR